MLLRALCVILWPIALFLNVVTLPLLMIAEVIYEIMRWVVVGKEDSIIVLNRLGSISMCLIDQMTKLKDYAGRNK